MKLQLEKVQENQKDLILVHVIFLKHNNYFAKITICRWPDRSGASYWTIPYVEPAVNRQPGFRRGAVEQRVEKPEAIPT